MTISVADYFNDADTLTGDALAYSIFYANGLAVGSWVQLNAATGSLIFTAGIANVGWNYFTVTATDKSNAALIQSFGLLVNSKPIIKESMNTLYATQGIPFAAKLSKTIFQDPDN